MGDTGSLTRAQHAVVFWAFLQADCEDCPELCNEVLSLSKDLNDNEATLCSLDFGGLETEGDLETDGHMSSSFTIALEGIEPFVNVPGPANLQLVAAELRDIAALLEHNIVTCATQNLTRNLTGSPSKYWKEYLHQEVQNILAHGVGLDHLQQERVLAALTFTLVKGVCLQAPRLLRSLFDSALQYLCPEGGR